MDVAGAEDDGRIDDDGLYARAGIVEHLLFRKVLGVAVGPQVRWGIPDVSLVDPPRPGIGGRRAARRAGRERRRRKRTRNDGRLRAGRPPACGGSPGCDSGARLEAAFSPHIRGGVDHRLHASGGGVESRRGENVADRGLHRNPVEQPPRCTRANENANRMPAGDQRPGDVGTEKTGGAGDENSHAADFVALEAECAL